MTTFMAIMMILGTTAATFICCVSYWDRNYNAAVAWGVAGLLSFGHALRYLAELSRVAG